MTIVHADPIEDLRRRTSVKWTAHPADVIPMFVAEMDYPLFPGIRDRLVRMIETSDTGYVSGPALVAEPFAGFAARRWGWQVDAGAVGITTDLSVAIVETLRRLIAPGDGVIVMPPVYPPFFDLIPEAGGTVIEVPLRREPDWTIDLEGVAAALAAGARAVLLCSPHNPLGLAHSRDQLAELARIVEAHDAVVVSDEIHAPLVHPDAEFVPYLTVSDAAAVHGMALHSASKAFGLAGLKCALMVAASDRMRRELAAMPEEVEFRTGLLGATASAVGYADGDAWLDGVREAIVESRGLLEELVAELLPRAVLTVPHAIYVAWLDLSAYGLGEDPAAVLLDRARVALGSGPAFGAQGRGHVRINYACSPELLREALHRIAAALGRSGNARAGIS